MTGDNIWQIKCLFRIIYTLRVNITHALTRLYHSAALAFISGNCLSAVSLRRTNVFAWQMWNPFLCYWKATKWSMCALCAHACARVCVGDTTFVQMPQIPMELGWFLRASKQPWDRVCMRISICYLGVHMLSSKCVASSGGSTVAGDKSHEEVIRDSALLPKKARVGETTGESAWRW